MRPNAVVGLGLALTLLCALDALAQPEENAARYAVGFRLVESEDATRLRRDADGAAQARPIRVYVWYPARGAQRPITFGRYAALADDDVWPDEVAPGLRAKLDFARGPLARSLAPADYDALLREPMLAAEDARALPGPFPLVAIGQGLYYESPIAFAATAEYLAARGFAVAAVPLAGTQSPVVKLDAQDLESQVRDLELGIALARELPFVSPDSLGVLGFDMGGMVGVTLTMRNRDVDAFVSLDSSILFEHASGLPRGSPDYDPLALRVPWFHATGWQAAGAGVTEPAAVVSAARREPRSLYAAAQHSERYLLVVDGIGHTDYTSYGLLEKRGGVTGYWAPATPERVAGHKAVRRYVASFFGAYLADDAAALADLSRAPGDAIPGVTFTLDHTAAKPAGITYDEVVALVISGRGDEAVAALRAAAALDPTHALLRQTSLERLVQSLLFTWGLADESIPVIELLAERYPSATSAVAFLAEAHVLAGRHGDAIAVLERYASEHPGDRGMRARLEQLREQNR